MSYVYVNPNPSGKLIGDCVVRAYAIANGVDWETAFLKLTLRAFIMHDMPSSNSVWGAQLMKDGFKRMGIPNTCPDCYTVKDFCRDYPTGIYVLGTGTHAVAVIDSSYYDAWDSGDEIPTYYWRKEIQ